MKVGIVKELGGEGYQAGVRSRFEESVALIESLGAEVVEVSCPSFPAALAAYYLILPSEASSNLAKFDGIRFGNRVGDDGSKRKIVFAGFGSEVIRIILELSTGYYDAYYGQAGFALNRKISMRRSPRLMKFHRLHRRLVQDRLDDPLMYQISHN
jgi:aspartyl-tRNA(Asn)/glutamyl-tRNA(Gln) amidotransferase subunit A